MTHEGLGHLESARWLRVLDLAGNPQLDDRAIEPLSRIPSLRLLFLGGTQITQAGVTRLSQALPKCAIFWNDGVIIPRPTPKRALGQSEREQLRDLLRDLISIDVGRVTFVATLRAYVASPNPADWTEIQTKAQANHKKLREGIERLTQLDSEFLVDETANFRQLLIDLEQKSTIYEQLIKTNFATDKPTLIKLTQTAATYEALIESLKKHEATVRGYLQGTE